MLQHLVVKMIQFILYVGIAATSGVGIVVLKMPPICKKMLHCIIAQHDNYPDTKHVRIRKTSSVHPHGALAKTCRNWLGT